MSGKPGKKREAMETMREEDLLFGKIADAQKEGTGIALATVVSTNKSSPRKAGARMVVYGDGSIAGTIGGGVLEKMVIEEAKKALIEGRPRKVEYSLDPEDPENITMCCGGEMEIFIDVVKSEAPLLIFGGGHVGEKIARIAELIGMPYIIVDDRKEYANRERFPQAADVRVSPYRESFDKITIGPETHIIICTHGHAHDLACLREALKTKASYIGVIASKDKIKLFRRQIREEGAVKYDDRVFSPIGLDLGDSSPGQIALSVMAEIVMLKSGGTGKHKRLPPG